MSSRISYQPYDMALMRIAKQLNEWADLSVIGGWSTHQVEPMRSLAANIRKSVVSDKYNDICKEELE